MAALSDDLVIEESSSGSSAAGPTRRLRSSRSQATTSGRSTSSELTSSIEDYIEMAKKKRAKQTKKCTSSKKVEDKHCQMMVPVGRMYHCTKRKRGVHMRSGGGPRNVLLRRDCSYGRMLAKCMSELYTEEERKNAEFYIADAKGIPVWHKDKIEVDMESSGKEVEEREWTLGEYLQLTNKSLSKSMFYCVREELESDDEAGQSSVGKRVVRKDRVKVDSDASSDGTELESVNEEIDTGNGHSTHEKMETEPAAHVQQYDSDNYIWYPFSPVFMKRLKSAYRDEWSFRTVHSQLDALVLSEKRDTVQDEYQHNTVGLVEGNPLHLPDFWLAGIDIATNQTGIDLIECCDRRSGVIHYKKPSAESTFGVWTGGFSCPGESVALLCCLATSGYHSCSSYMWSLNDEILEEETHAIAYVTSTGSYTCVVTVSGNEKHSFSFNVLADVANDRWKVVIPEGVNVCQGRSVDIALKRLSILNDVELNDYRKVSLKEVIGQGGYGTVYKANWRGMVVAAKVIPLPAVSADSNNVKSEIEFLKKLHHPNLSSLLGVEQLETSIAILTPLVYGKNLHEYIFSSDRKLVHPEKLYVLVQVCQALTYLHTCEPPLVHLDVKPANILVDAMTLHVTLTDFGLSHAMLNTSSIGTKTAMAGSPGYQSPEQLQALKKEIGPPSDVFAFGCVIVTLYSEVPLWPGLTPFQIMCKVTIHKEKPGTMSDVPGELRVLCEKCLDYNIANRPTIIEVQKGLACIKV